MIKQSSCLHSIIGSSVLLVLISWGLGHMIYQQRGTQASIYTPSTTKHMGRLCSLMSCSSTTAILLMWRWMMLWTLIIPVTKYLDGDRRFHGLFSGNCQPIQEGEYSTDYCPERFSSCSGQQRWALPPNSTDGTREMPRAVLEAGG